LFAIASPKAKTGGKPPVSYAALIVGTAVRSNEATQSQRAKPVRVCVI
jgi:hypothetical protein